MDERGAGHADGAGACTREPQTYVSTGGQQQGRPGADGMTVEQLADYTNQYWPILKARLLAGEYHPQDVRAVEIPKPRGGTRQLAFPVSWID